MTEVDGVLLVAFDVNAVAIYRSDTHPY
jgi:hypothetical protein